MKLNKIDDKVGMVALLVVLVVILFAFDSIGIIEKNTEPTLLGMITLSSPADDGLGFIIDDQVDKRKLEEFASMDYQVLKQKLGVNEDFAIALLDDDGNPIPVAGKPCIGAPGAKVAGYKCG